MSDIAFLLEDRSSPSVAVLLRSMMEASARASWLIDPALTAREMVARALIESFDEGRRVGQMGRERFQSLGQREVREPLANPLEETVMEIATQGGFSVEKAHGDLRVEGQRRPNTLELLKAVDGKEWDSSLSNLIPSMYRRGSAAAHGSLMGWAEMAVATKEDGGTDIRSLGLLATDLTSAMRLHVRAIDAWNSLIDWVPKDLLKETRHAALAGHGLAFAQLLKALGSRKGQSGGWTQR